MATGPPFGTPPGAREAARILMGAQRELAFSRRPSWVLDADDGDELATRDGEHDDDMAIEAVGLADVSRIFDDDDGAGAGTAMEVQSAVLMRSPHGHEYISPCAWPDARRAETSVSGAHAPLPSVSLTATFPPRDPVFLPSGSAVCVDDLPLNAPRFGDGFATRRGSKRHSRSSSGDAGGSDAECDDELQPAHARPRKRARQDGDHVEAEDATRGAGYTIDQSSDSNEI